MTDASTGMTIGVFARRTRLSLKALRLYEQQGLLVPAGVEAQGYRRYDESQLAVARRIALLRRLDMPLARVAEIVAAPGPRAAELVAAYWQEVEQRIASQRELAIHLRIMLAGGSVVREPYRIDERDVPEQLVLTERRHVRVDELEPWRRAARRRLTEAAHSCGGAAGAEFLLFHGEVNEDGDGPVELCLPVHGGDCDRQPTRAEPAHREAFVRVTKAQFEYPQILSVYDAIGAWIDEQGYAGAGCSREVMLGVDLATAAPGDDVCDVAFPIG